MSLPCFRWLFTVDVQRIGYGWLMTLLTLPGWWFQTFVVCHNIWDNPSHWLIFFRGVETTNQLLKGWKIKLLVNDFTRWKHAFCMMMYDACCSGIVDSKNFRRASTKQNWESMPWDRSYFSRRSHSQGHDLWNILTFYGQMWLWLSKVSISTRELCIIGTDLDWDYI